MNNNQIIAATVDYIKNKLQGEGSGHDWWHVYRVWKNALNIAQHEKANLFVVQLGALLHDVADWKFYDGDIEIGSRVSRDWLESLDVDDVTIDHVCEIVRCVSFKGAKVDSTMQTIEGKIVQDADRLDAIGAIGIARTFAYGGSKGREMYNPEQMPQVHESFEQYKNNVGTTVNHFYEKLLLLKGLMNTETAKIIAEQRHVFMVDFLDQFYKEWNGEVE